jgi:hypothetical protein
LVGQLGSIAFSTVISYLGHKFFTFHPHKEEEGSSDVTVT